MQTKHAAVANEAARSSDEEEDYQELPSSRDSDAHPAADSDTDHNDSDLADEANTARDAAVLDEGVSDLDYLKSRMKAGVGQAEADDKADSETSSLTDTGPGKEATDNLLDCVYRFCLLSCQSPNLLQTALHVVIIPDSHLQFLVPSSPAAASLPTCQHDSSLTKKAPVLLKTDICRSWSKMWVCLPTCPIYQKSDNVCEKSTPGK